MRKWVEIRRDVYSMQGKRCFGIIQVRYTCLILIFPRWDFAWQVRIAAHKRPFITFYKGHRIDPRHIN